jgi:hypothetical protein
MHRFWAIPGLLDFDFVFNMKFPNSPTVMFEPSRRAPPPRFSSRPVPTTQTALPPPRASCPIHPHSRQPIPT